MIPLAKQNINEEAYQSLIDVIKSGWWTMGKVTQQLEKEFAEFKGVKHAIAVSSCSAALHMAVRACFNKKGYRSVIISPLTFCSTVNSILFNRGTPAFYDVDEDTYCIDLKPVLESKLCYFQGIILVHFAGHPCDMDIVAEIKDKFKNVWIVEDCAHAVEGKWCGDHIGTYGDVSCFSFNPTKNLAAPEMGMIITNNDEIAKKIRLWRLHGMSTGAFDRVVKPGSYDIKELGYKYNCTDVEAVVALHQLANIKDNWGKRFFIWRRYCDALDDLGHNNYYNGRIRLPVLHSVFTAGNLNRHFDSQHALHLFQIEVDKRDQFIQKMREKDIYCGIHYKPVHQHSFYTQYKNKDISLEKSEWIGRHTVSLPLGPGMIEEDVEYVVDNMREILKQDDYLLKDFL